MDTIKQLKAWLKDKSGDSYAIQAVLNCIRDIDEVEAAADVNKSPTGFIDGVFFPASSEEISFCLLQFVELVRRGTKTLAIFDELSVPLMAFSVSSSDMDGIETESRVNSHYSSSLIPAPINFNLGKLLIENYVSTDTLSSDVSNRALSQDACDSRDFLSYLINCCESDENLLRKIFWSLRSAAESSCAKFRGKLDPKTDRRVIDDGSYFLLEAFIVLVARLVLNSKEFGANCISECECYTYVMSSHCGVCYCALPPKRRSNSFEELAPLFAPFEYDITSNDDLSALWAILARFCADNDDDRNVAVESVSESDVMMRRSRSSDDRRIDVVDSVHMHYVCGTSRGADAEETSDLTAGQQATHTEGLNVEASLSSADPWREVTPGCSLLTANTALLLCGGLPHLTGPTASPKKGFLSRVSIARTFLSSTEQSLLDDILSTSLRGPLFTSTSGSEAAVGANSGMSILSSLSSQCRFVEAVKGAMESAKGSLSLSESNERRNQRLHCALRSSIGQGSFQLRPGADDARQQCSGGGSSTVKTAAYAHKAAILGDSNPFLCDLYSEGHSSSATLGHSSAGAVLFPYHPQPTEPRLKTRKTFVWPIPSPLHPREVLLTGMDIDECRVLRSSKYPALLVFCACHSGIGCGSRGLQDNFPTLVQSSPPSSANSCPPCAPPSVSYKALFKQGDDVRQDELAMLLVRFMDRVLRGVGLDLRLVTYEVLSLGPKEGLIQWVDGAQPLSSVIDSYSAVRTQHKSPPYPYPPAPNPIQAFLRHHSPCDIGEFGVKGDTMETFVRSCAGYSVITYVLGVGDRHLDNLMLLPTGHFFHVDYGFLFGRDPKPFHPPLRFTGEMLAALGGQDHPLHQHFLTLSSRAFNALRQQRGALLSLVLLMAGAGITDLSLKQTPQEALEGVLDRLQPQLSEEAAAAFMRGVLADAASAFMPRMMEHMHRIASTFR